jgi:hypothetical protein
VNHEKSSMQLCLEEVAIWRAASRWVRSITMTTMTTMATMVTVIATVVVMIAVGVVRVSIVLRSASNSTVRRMHGGNR